jgi:hypothetical protein
MFQFTAIITVITEPVSETARERRGSLQYSIHRKQMRSRKLLITSICTKNLTTSSFLLLKVCDDGTAVQILCFRTLSIVLSLSKTVLFYFSKHNVSETGFCLRLQVKPTQLGPTISGLEIGTSSMNGAQLIRFYLKTETESSFRNVMFWKMNRTGFR